MKSTRLLCCIAALAFAGSIGAQTKVPAKPAAKAAASSEKTFFGRNLVKNGGAASEQASGEVTGWTAPEFSTSTYGHTSGEWDWNVEGAPNGGCCYFRLAWDGEAAEKSATQTIDLTPGAAQIDGGEVNAKLSGYIGGMTDGSTAGLLTISWQDEAGKELGTLATELMNPSELPQPKVGAASLKLYEKSDVVPKGARKAVLKLTAKPHNDPNGQYLLLADNISLVLKSSDKQ